MASFTDYTYYTDTYKGALTEVEYNASVLKAHQEILVRTLGRETEEMEDALKMCECELVDVIGSYSKTESGGVASVNNDGYSVSYENASEYAEGKAKKINAVCNLWLTHPVNLLLRWV